MIKLLDSTDNEKSNFLSTSTSAENNLYEVLDKHSRGVVQNCQEKRTLLTATGSDIDSRILYGLSRREV